MNEGNGEEQRNGLAERVANAQFQVEQFPESPESWDRLGQVLLESGLLEEANDAFEEAIGLDPDDVEAHYGRGVVLGSFGDYEGAMAEFRFVISCDPTASVPHFMVGNCLRMLGRMEDAIEAIQKGLDMDPENGHAVYNLGLVYADCGRLEEAVIAFRRAFELQPDFGVAVYELGKTWVRLFRGEKALETQRHLEGSIDLKDPTIIYYLALGFLGLGEQKSATDQHAELAKMAPDLAEDLADILREYSETRPDNEPLRQALMKGAATAGVTGVFNAEAGEAVLRALMEANLIVPTTGKPDETAGGSSLSIATHEVAGCHMLVAFTDMASARRFFHDQPVSRVVMSFPSLCDLVVKSTQAIAKGDLERALEGLIVLNPGGPVPFVPPPLMILDFASMLRGRASGSLEIDSESVWSRIVEHAGETFHQIRGKAFTYSIAGNSVKPDSVNRCIHVSQFEQALEFVPLHNTKPVQHLQGPSYLYAILMDDRIRGEDW
jgi:tetratricopeptide (TPR) repeat protein